MSNDVPRLLKPVAGRKFELEDKTKEAIAILEKHIELLKSGEVSADHCLVFYADSSSVDELVFQYDVVGRYTVMLGMLEFLKSRMVEDMMEGV